MEKTPPNQALEQAQAALHASQARFSELVENIEEVFYSRNATTGELLYISPACERLMGRDLQSFYDKPGRFLVNVHPDDLKAVKAAAEATLGGLKTQIEYRLIKPGGEIVWVCHYAHLVGDRVLGTLRDISARKQADAELARSTRALKLLSQSNRALTRMEDELQLLGEICRLAVDVGGYRMAWVGYARNDADRSVEPMAHAGHEAGYLRSVRLSWAEEPAGTPGSACDAIRRNEVCESSDLHDEPGDFPLPQQALTHGYGSVLALPLRLGGQTLGVLALYSVEAQAAANPANAAAIQLESFPVDYVEGADVEIVFGAHRCAGVDLAPQSIEARRQPRAIRQAPFHRRVETQARDLELRR